MEAIAFPSLATSPANNLGKLKPLQRENSVKKRPASDDIHEDNRTKFIKLTPADPYEGSTPVEDLPYKADHRGHRPRMSFDTPPSPSPTVVTPAESPILFPPEDPDEAFAARNASSATGLSKSLGPNPLQCAQCGKGVKNSTELQRHLVRHQKLYICHIGGCGRKDGFGTLGDLRRHQRSVHGQGIPHTYRCYSPGCRGKNKTWSRWDNLKAHIKRRHEDENLETLLKLSKETPIQKSVDDNPFEGMVEDIFALAEKEVMHYDFGHNLTNDIPFGGLPPSDSGYFHWPSG